PLPDRARPEGSQGGAAFGAEAGGAAAGPGELSPLLGRCLQAGRQAQGGAGRLACCRAQRQPHGAHAFESFGTVRPRSLQPSGDDSTPYAPRSRITMPGTVRIIPYLVCLTLLACGGNGSKGQEKLDSGALDGST